MTASTIRIRATNMAAATKGEPQQHQHYSPLPPDPNPNYYILLPYSRRPRRRLKRTLLCLASLLFLLILAAFLLWPSDPKISVVRVHLDRLTPHLSPSPSLDVDLALTVRIRNPNFFSLRYRSLVVSIAYRGRELGFADSSSGLMRARASSYVNATLVLDGIRVIHDAVYLIEDLAKGVIPFDTVTEVKGTIGLFFFDIPIKAKVSCEIYADTNNQTVTHQNCYPE